MCGIGLIINYGEEKINLDMVETMFKNMEDRGDDASGIYYERPGKDGNIINRVFKAPVPASDLWNSVQGYDSKFKIPATFQEKWKLDGTERLIMLHTRTATRGTVSNNHNNMPIYSENWVLVHNGCVNAPRVNSFKYKGEVDSEDILAHIEHSENISDALKGVQGSMAIIVRPLKAKHLYMYRNSNPLEIVVPINKKLLFACSSRDFVLDNSSLELMGKDNPFIEGSVTEIVKPNVLYTVGIHEPIVEAMVGDVNEEEDALDSTRADSTWGYTLNGHRNYCD